MAELRNGPRIASQHANDLWRPLLAWPDGALVQWGGSGVVLGQKPYRTAFFEAFPGDGSAGFIRGEGETVEAAEAAAHAEWTKNAACHAAGGHRWTRALRVKKDQHRSRPSFKVNTYTNGGCFCLRCGSFATVMKPIVELQAFRKPLSIVELDSMASGFCRRSPWSKESPRETKWRRHMALRAKAAGLALPEITPADPDKDPFKPDAYELACEHAVGAYCRAHLELLEAKGGNGVGDLFDSLHRRSLRRLADATPVPAGRAR